MKFTKKPESKNTDTLKNKACVLKSKIILVILLCSRIEKTKETLLPTQKIFRLLINSTIPIISHVKI
jgi:hypothetical protein